MTALAVQLQRTATSKTGCRAGFAPASALPRGHLLYTGFLQPSTKRYSGSYTWVHFRSLCMILWKTGAESDLARLHSTRHQLRVGILHLLRHPELWVCGARLILHGLTRGLEGPGLLSWR